MVAEAPTMWSAVVTDQVFRASHGNRLRRQSFASGEDRSRFYYLYSGTSRIGLAGSQPLVINSSLGTLSDPDGLFEVSDSGNGPVVAHTGHYMVAGSVGINSHPWPTGTAVQLWFNVGGVAYFTTSHSVTSSAGIYVSTFGVVPLTAGDKVTLWASTSAASGPITNLIAFSLVCVGW